MSSSNASFDSSSDSETAEMEVEYDLEVEVMSNASEQKDTSDDDEPEDVYAHKPQADKNWLAQYETERKMEQELEEKLPRRLSGAEELKEWFVLVWHVVASENNAFIQHFLSFY